MRPLTKDAADEGTLGYCIGGINILQSGGYYATYGYREHIHPLKKWEQLNTISRSHFALRPSKKMPF